ncbi:MAG: methyltransferase domain-containing protein [Pseudomonadales bacterium]|nr:methyltransferase domain-containing protein [Pseudomonadales bacterium]
MDSDEALAQIRGWFTTRLGKHVLNAEKAILEQLLPGFFGYDLLQVSVQNTPLFDASPVRHRYAMSLVQDDPNDFRANATCLPFQDDSLDVVLLHHLLDFFQSPHKLLREAARVALPMGHLVIIGFNPVSLWGAYQPVGRLRQQAPWFGDFIRPGRLMDWLNVLNFKIDRAQYTTYGLPLAGYSGKIPDYSHGLSRNANLPFGAVYVIVARKQVGTITPIKPRWHQNRAFGRLSVVPPMANGASRNNRNKDTGED